MAALRVKTPLPAWMMGEEEEGGRKEENAIISGVSALLHALLPIKIPYATMRGSNTSRFAEDKVL